MATAYVSYAQFPLSLCADDIAAILGISHGKRGWRSGGWMSKKKKFRNLTASEPLVEISGIEPLTS